MGRLFGCVYLCEKNDKIEKGKKELCRFVHSRFHMFSSIWCIECFRTENAELSPIRSLSQSQNVLLNRRNKRLQHLRIWRMYVCVRVHVAAIAYVCAFDNSNDRLTRTYERWACACVFTLISNTLTAPLEWENKIVLPQLGMRVRFLLTIRLHVRFK